MASWMDHPEGTFGVCRFGLGLVGLGSVCCLRNKGSESGDAALCLKITCSAMVLRSFLTSVAALLHFRALDSVDIRDFYEYFGVVNGVHYGMCRRCAGGEFDVDAPVPRPFPLALSASSPEVARLEPQPVGGDSPDTDSAETRRLCSQPNPNDAPETDNPQAQAEDPSSDEAEHWAAYYSTRANERRHGDPDGEDCAEDVGEGDDGENAHDDGDNGEKDTHDDAENCVDVEGKNEVLQGDVASPPFTPTRPQTMTRDETPSAPLPKKRPAKLPREEEPEAKRPATA